MKLDVHQQQISGTFPRGGFGWDPLRTLLAHGEGWHCTLAGGMDGYESGSLVTLGSFSETGLAEMKNKEHGGYVRDIRPYQASDFFFAIALMCMTSNMINLAFLLVVSIVCSLEVSGDIIHRWIQTTLIKNCSFPVGWWIGPFFNNEYR